ncbi:MULTISPECIES: response regulator transcription factor [Novosphingobium]|jgi:DNA-binding NarL/FixJ family response regulator|uniref:response regulator transcription factor n=1 Tax=Novosphingobium TaxID=165696 RepID=UPI0022F28756|nr:response regulator transcription factor [Novosphingobium resinovorum]GLK42283.1 DNA-binding response regulator [Novosphingobium resinovorum]
METLAVTENNMGEYGAPDRVLIVDDHSLVRDGLRSIFDDAFPDCTILEADSLEAALRVLDEAGDVDLVLLDLNIPDVSHLSGLQAVRDKFPATPVVMVSGVTDRNVVRDALAAGAAGFVPKSLKRAAIVDALQQVLSGEIYMPDLPGDESAAAEEDLIRARIDTLTPQQRVVLGHLVAGRLNKQIAYELDVSMTTVKAHVSAILQKMNVFSRTQAVIMAGKAGFRG